MLKLLTTLSCSVFLASSAAFSATITVETFGDEVPPQKPDGCSLRDAIQSANDDDNVGSCKAGSGTDEIVFDQRLGAGSINIQGALPPITDDLTISGTGAGNLAIEAGGSGRIFTINGGDVTIRDISINSGLAHPTLNGFGGGVLINDANGHYIIEKVRFTGNNAEESGGGLAFIGAGRLEVRDSEFLLNEAVYLGNSSTVVGGGAIYLELGGANVAIERTTFEGNSAIGGPGSVSDEARGGGVLAFVDPGSNTNNRLTINHSTFQFNRSWGDGGAIAVHGPLRARINSATIVSNGSDQNKNTSGAGGGIASLGQSEIRIKNTAVTKNSSYNIITQAISPNCMGNVLSDGHNFIGTDSPTGTTTSCTNAMTTDIIEFEPQLGGLTYNPNGFGKTRIPGAFGTPGPLAGSGECTARIDQNLVQLPVGSACEIGAAERP